jgi:predicted MFS family arabinose efflux permease
MLPNCAPSEKRNSLFALYVLIAQLAGAAGSLYGGLPSVFRNSLHFSLVDSYKPIFASYTIVAIIAATLYMFMSNKVELARPQTGQVGEKLTPASRSLIAKMTLLFGIDAFAGGFIIQTLVSYWFSTKFGTPVGYLALIFFLTGVFSSGGLILAGKLADRIGAVNTMVFTHLPSNVLLILVPLMPTFAASLSLYLTRSAISLMDVPARQSYTVSVVKSRDRLTATSVTNISRNAARAASPTIAGYALLFSLSLPFFISGIFYMISDLGIYASFRNVKPIKESV